MIDTSTFKSYECPTVFKINHEITCKSEGIIYLILDLICHRSYVGSTVDSMKIRMSNYKNHLKIQHKGCEMAQHFVEAPDSHSLLVADGENVRSRKFQDEYDSHLGKQINVILIEYVDLSSAGTTREKRELLEVREGYWQTQLRTLSRYGGLNKKDERKISNKRLANTLRVAVSSTLQDPPALPPPTPGPPHTPPTLTQPIPGPSLAPPMATPTPPSPTLPQPLALAASPSPPLRRSSRLRKQKLCSICD